MTTNETKHTPGPWMREGNFIYALTANTSPYRTNSPAEVNYFQCQVTSGGRDGATPEELSKISSLIHSAPELLEALHAQTVSDEAAEQYMSRKWDTGGESYTDFEQDRTELYRDMKTKQEKAIALRDAAIARATTPTSEGGL